MARRSIFISYAHEDRPDVESSADLLRAGGVQVFLDVRSIDYGDRWQDVLRDALNKCERVMVFWSLAARASEWVDREWRYALSLGKRIVPTLLDGTPLPDELQQFQVLPRYRRAPDAGTGLPSLTRPVPSPASRAPATRLLATAAAVATLAGGMWVWLGVPATRSVPTQSVGSPPAEQQPSPLLAASSSVVPKSAAVPAAPATTAPASGLVGVKGDLDLVGRAGRVATEPGSTAMDMLNIQARLSVILEAGYLERYDTADLKELAVVSRRALDELRAVKTMIAQGRGSFETEEETKAFKVLLAQMEAVDRQVRGTAVPTATPASSPAPVAQASSPRPASAASAVAAPAQEPGWMGSSPQWWTVALGALALLCAAVTYPLLRGRRFARRSEAQRFVSQVFAD
jgi:TIR domain